MDGIVLYAILNVGMCCLVLVWVLAYRAFVQVSLCYVSCVSSLYALSIELINAVNFLFNVFY
jgi:hypothetical protein